MHPRWVVSGLSAVHGAQGPTQLDPTQLLGFGVDWSSCLLPALVNHTPGLGTLQIPCPFCARGIEIGAGGCLVFRSLFVFSISFLAISHRGVGLRGGAFHRHSTSRFTCWLVDDGSGSVGGGGIALGFGVRVFVASSSRHHAFVFSPHRPMPPPPLLRPPPDPGAARGGMGL